MTHESQSLIPPELKTKLLQGLSLLEDVPEDQNNWRPMSNEQVLDLIDPSLYPFRVGHSHVLRGGRSACDLTLVLDSEYEKPYGEPFVYGEPPRKPSLKFQRLPTDFRISDDKSTATALGYINNLHPIRHCALYPPLASTIARFVPLFERVLNDVLTDDHFSPIGARFRAVDPEEHEWYKHIDMTGVADPMEDEDADEDEWEDWKATNHWPRIPDPAPFDPSRPPNRYRHPSPHGTNTSLAGRTLQVIVKAVQVVLTPDAPRYTGGAPWHVEGTPAERIVACGAYCYEATNIGAVHVALRGTVANPENEDVFYQAGDHQGYIVAYGFGDGQPLRQNFGAMMLEEDKCVAWPNFYQRYVEPFELVDKTKPGHMKALAFFLVDPWKRILSTSDVPPQQAEWQLYAVSEVPKMQKLPKELFDMIMGPASAGTMSLEEAKLVRETLVADYAAFAAQHTKDVFECLFDVSGER